MSSSSSKNAYLQRYMSSADTSVASKTTRRKKKRKEECKKIKSGDLCVRDDTDDWQANESRRLKIIRRDKEKQIASSAQSAQAIQAARIAKQIRMRKQDGSGWVTSDYNGESVTTAVTERNDHVNKDTSSSHHHHHHHHHHHIEANSIPTQSEFPTQHSSDDVNDDSDDLSPPRRQRRHDDDDDDVDDDDDDNPNDDLSPPRRRRQRHDDDDDDDNPNDDLSPPRRRRRRHDDDDDDSDDLSPPRRHHETVDTDMSEKDLSTHENSEASMVESCANVEAKVGLQTGQQFGQKLRREREDRDRRVQRLDNEHAHDTIVRDSEGRVVSVDDIKRQEEEDAKKKAMPWASGIVQKKQLKKQHQLEAAQDTMEFSRRSDDTIMNENLRRVNRWGDPMLELMPDNVSKDAIKKEKAERKLRKKEHKLEKKKKKMVKHLIKMGVENPQATADVLALDEDESKEIKASADALRVELHRERATRPVYGGVPWPHRYGADIKPGYRWNGQERDNGWESKRYKMAATHTAMITTKYHYSAEDM